MKYLLLFCVEEKTWDAMSAEELEAIRCDLGSHPQFQPLSPPL